MVRQLLDDALVHHAPGALDALDAWLARTLPALSTGDATAVDEALTFLEADPFYFRSGYVRTKLARRLAHAALSPADRERAREIVLSSVDGTRHCGLTGLGPLARSVADNRVRRVLRSQLHSADVRVARRALRTIVKVSHPGLTAADLATARSLVLDDARSYPAEWPAIRRLARSLWSAGWADELREVARHHGPLRAAARRLLESVPHEKGWRSGP